MTDSTTIVRVLRLVEYVGPREQVERQVANSIHGTRRVLDMSITAVTVNEFPLPVQIIHVPPSPTSPAPTSPAPSPSVSDYIAKHGLLPIKRPQPVPPPEDAETSQFRLECEGCGETQICSFVPDPCTETPEDPKKVWLCNDCQHPRSNYSVRRLGLA